jgi:sugar phosphate isomerase/epimerase
MIDKLDDKHFAICFDTGHLNMNGGDLIDFVRKGGKKIKALHIADNEGREDQHMMPCGRGHIDFITIFKELKAVGYDELYNLEIPGENGGPFEVRILKLKYILQMMDILDRLSD